MHIFLGLYERMSVRLFQTKKKLNDKLNAIINTDIHCCCKKDQGITVV